jgi:hypothetical protein
MDLIVCTQVTFKVLDSKLEQSNSRYGLDDGFHFTVKAHKFQARMTYYKYFNNLEQVEHEIFFYPSGLRNKIIPVDLKPIKEIVYDDNNNEVVQLTFGLPKNIQNQIGYGSKLLFATRLKVDAEINSFFPYILNGKERWLGSLVRLHAGNSAGSSIFNQKLSFKVATLNKLQQKGTW